MLGEHQVIKTITLKANDPLISVDLYISALDNTTAIAQTSTFLDTDMRTDDLGFGAFTHTVDPRPIAPGDVTYRRAIFYPVMYWSDVSSGGIGLTVITHGLQGVGGTATRSIMLLRQVTSRDEGLTDPGIHHLRYAYLPHSGTAVEARPWLAAYEFNQPLIVTWKAGDKVYVRLPFDSASVRQLRVGADAVPLPATFSPLSPSAGISDIVIADIPPQGQRSAALVVNYAPTTSVIIPFGSKDLTVPKGIVSLVSFGDYTTVGGGAH